MNILDKLAVSLLVCCGMLVGQIDAAMPGAFTKVTAPNRERAVDFSRTATFQMEAKFFLIEESYQFTNIRYDALSRTIETLRPGGERDLIVQQGYSLLDGLPTTYSKTMNAAGQLLERWENQHGNLVQSKDPSGQTTTFLYDVESRLSETRIDGTPLLKNTFDTCMFRSFCCYGFKLCTSKVF